MIYLVVGHDWTPFQDTSFPRHWTVAAFADPDKAQAFANECEAFARTMGDNPEHWHGGPDKSGGASRRAEYDVEEVEVR